MINHLVIRFIQIAKQSFVFFVKFVVCITLFVVIVQSELLHLYLCACIFLIVIIEIIANFHNIHTIKKIRKEKHVSHYNYNITINFGHTRYEVTITLIFIYIINYIYKY